MCFKRKPSNDQYERVPCQGSPVGRCLCKSTKIILIILLVLIIVSALLIFIVLPITFMCSLKLQTFLIFTNIDQPSNPEYENFAKYGVHGVRNLYVTVMDDEILNITLSLGVWHLLPDDLVDNNINNSDHEFETLLAQGAHPTVIYFHGNSGTRIFPLETYTVLRKYFHVIAFDYRSYADSTSAPLSEDAVVRDSMQMYKWVRSKTIGKIFVYGHSLGTGLSTHTVKRLSEENIIPTGLFLEAPFTSIRDAVRSHPLAKVLSWLPYFTQTILDPLEDNGFHFKSIINILDVNCPIMIMHAEDDIIIPYEQGYELSEVARKERDIETQGPVTYHQFPAYFGYNHMGLSRDPNLPGYVKKFMEECLDF